MSLLEQNTLKKGRIDEMSQPELERSSRKEYEINAIYDSKVYANESEGYLPGLYYLVSWKDYSKEENIKKPTLTI